jgi:hypothetical protein
MLACLQQLVCLLLAVLDRLASQGFVAGEETGTPLTGW